MIKKRISRLKALRVHPKYRYVEDVVLSTGKEISHGSKKLFTGSAYGPNKSTYSKDLYNAVMYGERPKRRKKK